MKEQMIFEPEIINSKVVGVTFEGRQQVIQAIERIKQSDKNAVKLFLQRDLKNTYDPFAIAVYVTYYDSSFLSEVTRQVGFLRKEMAAQFVDDMSKGYSFEIVDFESTGGYDHTRGINVQILRKEATMPTITAMDLLNKKTSSGERSEYLRLSEGVSLTIRFLKPLKDAFIQATHSIQMPDGKRERFAALQYVNGVKDEEVEDPALAIDPEPWVKLVLPVIDRVDGKVKLFAETVAVYKKLKIFEDTPKTDLEKTVKIGDITKADIQIFQQGKGKDRQIVAMPIASTIRELTDAEKALKTPDPKLSQRILTKAEIEEIVKKVSQNQAAATMSVPAASGPFVQS